MPPTLEGQITMEKTPSYWVTRSAPKRVYAMNPSVKLLAVVRDPVTRAISDYTQSARYLCVPTSTDLKMFCSTFWKQIQVDFGHNKISISYRLFRRHVPASAEWDAKVDR